MTVMWFKHLALRQEQLKSDWVLSAFTGDQPYDTLQRNAAAIGQANLLKELVELDFEEIEKIIYDTKY